MRLSIIIPTRNRDKDLNRTLISLAQLKPVLFDYEVIVVDNGSTDDTKSVTESYFNQFEILRYIYDDVPGLLTGRHRGAQEAKGEILAIIDDDIIADHYWIEGIFETFKDPDVHFATGPCLPKFESPPPEWIKSYWYDNQYGSVCVWLSLMDFGNEIIDINPAHIWGLNYCIRRTTLFELGGFHPDCIPSHLQQYQGDGETGLSFKGVQKGYRAIYNPMIKIWHVVSKERLKIEYFEKRAFYQGVCDSYTQIRRERHLEKVTLPAAITDGNKIKSFFESIKNFKNNLDKNTKYKARTNKAYADGFNFHFNAVKADPEILKWVLKEDYWDYKLPDK